MSQQGQITDPKAAISFILAGKATVTFRSLATDQRFTFKISRAPKNDAYPNAAPTWFVKLLNGPDNSNDFVYIGFVRGNEFVHGGPKARAGKDAPSCKGFDFVMKSLVAGGMKGFEVYHAGKCGRCGRKLTVPESIASGFGPECIHLVGATPAQLHATDDEQPSVSGKAAPQVKLNFDGTKTPTGQVRGAKAGSSTVGAKMNGRAVAAAVYAPTANDTLDTMTEKIEKLIAEYKATDYESYSHDGELDEDEAHAVAASKFRRQLNMFGVGA
jgi:Family of unknown function (DUF6011)